MLSDLKSPFPWNGGKSRAADLIWRYMGDPHNYVEPFLGSGAVLLGRPSKPSIETVNDSDGFVVNAFRSIKLNREETLRWADNPVFENDLHARHAWLKERRTVLTRQLEGDPEYHDSKIAGWWLWGIACWIGSDWCNENFHGPWEVIDSKLINTKSKDGIKRKIPLLGNSGVGVNKWRSQEDRKELLSAWFNQLSIRLENVRICCGDWSRVCTPSVTYKLGVTGILLDPPYSETADRYDKLYNNDDLQLSYKVKDWALINGDNPKLRIALCGYEKEFDMPNSWECVSWDSRSGYSGQNKETNDNHKQERIWFSPYCIKPGKLF